jgi:hypothetical protein
MSLRKQVVLRTDFFEVPDSARRPSMFFRTWVCGVLEESKGAIGMQDSHGLLLDAAVDDLHRLGVEGNRARSIDDLQG